MKYNIITFNEWCHFISEYTENVIKNDIKIDKVDQEKDIEEYINHLRKEKRMKKTLKVIMLGFTEVGKSYYLASINNLRAGTEPNNFSMQYENYIDTDQFRDMRAMIEKSSISTVFTTIKLVHTPMIFKHSSEQLFKIEFTDIEGQAVEPGRNIESANLIKNYIRECDAIIMVLKAPTNEIEKDKAIAQFSQIRLFAEELITKKESVPVCMVINQIDLLPNAKGISASIEKRIRDNKTNKSDTIKWEDVVKELDIEGKAKGEAHSIELQKVLYNRQIVEVVNKFNSWILAQSKRIPSRVFFTTSVGFDNVHKDQDSLVGNMKPFGSIASILWIIYAYMKTNESELTELGLKSEVYRKLAEDLEYQHRTGYSFFDDNNKYWNLRNLIQLYPIHDANRNL